MQRLSEKRGLCQPPVNERRNDRGLSLEAASPRSAAEILITLPSTQGVREWPQSGSLEIVANPGRITRSWDYDDTGAKSFEEASAKFLEARIWPMS